MFIFKGSLRGYYKLNDLSFLCFSVNSLSFPRSIKKKFDNWSTLCTNKSKSKLNHKACFFVFVGFWFSKRRFGEKQPNGVNPSQITNTLLLCEDFFSLLVGIVHLKALRK